MRPDPDALRGLLERVTAATGPDRELDVELWWLGERKRASGQLRQIAESRGASDAADYCWHGSWRLPPEGTARLPAHTASPDAVMALVKRELPEATWGVFSDGRAWVWPGGVMDLLAGHSARGATPALGLCAALLTALLAQADGAADVP